MKVTDYAGLDYSGPGATCNRLKGTDVRYGVMHQRCIHPDIEPELDYGDPHCPKCGERANEQGEFDYYADCKVTQCVECKRVAYPMELDHGDTESHCPECGGKVEWAEFEQYHTHQCEDLVCLHCRITFDSEVAYPDEPVAQTLEEGDCSAIQCLDTDWMVTMSPFITRAQFCSPCVPGAGNLESPCESGPVTLCFGHNFFEGEKAPYPVCLLQPWLDDQKIVMVLPDGDEREYQNWETVFAVWQMRKGQ